MNKDSSKLELTISREFGVSPFDAGVLTGLSSFVNGVEVERFDQDGRGALLWLTHRGLVVTEDHLGILSVRLSSSGASAIRLCRKLMAVPTPPRTSSLPSPGVPTTDG